MTSAFHIRDAVLPDDKPALLSFIDGLQAFEHRMEPDRRVDERVAEDYWAILIPRLQKNSGRIFVADGGAKGLLGWAVATEDDNDVYVVANERRIGYIAELFVVEAARGLGVGRALIAACEEWARARKLKVLMIGVLAGNARAARIYDEQGFSPYSVQRRKYL